MIIYYGVRKKIKLDKELGETVCPNCGHKVNMALAHEACHAHVFYIPVFFYTGFCMKMCPVCGISEALTNKEFKTIKKQ